MNIFLLVSIALIWVWILFGHVYRAKKGKNCYGLTLWRWNRLQIEIWLCPSNFSIGKHIHEHFDGEIMLLIGNVKLCKVIDGKEKSTGEHFRWLSVPRNVIHYFTPKSGARIPTLFINVERWDTRPTSGSIDMVFTESK